jgi:hypothetical protein
LPGGPARGTVAEDSGPSAVDVLANDTDVDGGPKAIASVTQPANGVVAITGGGTGVTYTPDADYCNTPPGTSPDTFTYTLTPGGSSTTVSIKVTCVDDAPTADDETFDGSDAAVGNTALVVDDPSDGPPAVAGPKKSISGDILAGDSDPDGPGPLVVVARAFATNDGGSVVLESDGDFTFTPAPGTSCTDHSDFFDYTVQTRRRGRRARTPAASRSRSPAASGTSTTPRPATRARRRPRSTRSRRRSRRRQPGTRSSSRTATTQRPASTRASTSRTGSA